MPPGNLVSASGSRGDWLTPGAGSELGRTTARVRGRKRTLLTLVFGSSSKPATQVPSGVIDVGH
jgi:hypothetical protein